mgnify:CR=1 FL=1
MSNAYRQLGSRRTFLKNLSKVGFSSAVLNAVLAGKDVASEETPLGELQPRGSTGPLVL